SGLCARLTYKNLKLQKYKIILPIRKRVRERPSWPPELCSRTLTSDGLRDRQNLKNKKPS
ncbi:MAG: hypothetical protein AB7O96_11885, partial [Pseudobdellovibrionaceae bacterium]